MSAKDSLYKIIDHLSEPQLGQLLEYSQFLAWQEQRNDWREFGMQQFARAYGPNEPDYSTSDVKTESAS